MHTPEFGIATCTQKFTWILSLVKLLTAIENRISFCFFDMLLPFMGELALTSARRHSVVPAASSYARRSRTCR